MSGKEDGEDGEDVGQLCQTGQDGGPSRDSESNAKSKENRAPLKSSQTLTLTRG